MQLTEKIGLFPLMLGVLLLGLGMALAQGYGSPMHDGVPPSPPAGTATGDINMGGNNFTMKASGNIYHDDDVGTYWGTGIDILMEHRNASSDTCFTGDDIDGAGSPGDLMCFDNGTDEVIFPQAEVVLGATGATTGICLDGQTASNLFVYGGDCLSIKNIQAQNIIANGYLRSTTQTIQMGSIYTHLDAGASDTDGVLRILNAAESQGVLLDTTADGVLALSDEASSALALRILGIKGAYSMVDTNTESVTFANDASKTTTTTLIPDGVFLVGVSTRVVTAGAGCATVDIGDGVDQDLFGDNTAIADATTTDGADATAAFSNPILADTEVTITANGGNCTAGVWAITSHFIQISAATAD